jgi:hypothetical protein
MVPDTPPVRTILGFAVAPLAVPVAVILSFLGGYLMKTGWFRDKPFSVVAEGAAGFAMVACLVAYAAAGLVGIPAYLIARKRGWLSFAQSAAIGSVVAVLPLVLLFAVWIVEEPGLVKSAFLQGVTWIFLFAMCGASTGAAFWFIALRRRRVA